MAQSDYSERLNPRLISTVFILFGVMWAFSTLFFLVQMFPAPGIFVGWEYVGCFSSLLVTAALLYFLIRHNEKSLVASQEALARASRALKARSDGSQLVVRATDEQELMEKICRLIVESEGYRLAWVGFAENDPEQTIRPVAQWGYETGYLETIRISWGDNEHGQGPTGAAIRSGTPSIVQHILTDPKWQPWREKAIRYGYASSISLPLKDGGQVYGALVIFAGEPDAFHRQEVALLKGLADDLSYGITTLRMRSERERGKNERKLLATIVEQESDGVLTFSTEGAVLYVNSAFEAISGYRRQELVGRDIRDFERTGPNRNFFRVMADTLAKGQAKIERFVNRRHDGTLSDVETRIFPVCGPDGVIAYAAVIRDRTHEVQLERQLCQAQKMEAIATLAGGIAHDFNNILAAIVTNAEMALDHVPEDATLRDHLAIVLKAAFRARNLVKQILTLSCQAEKERQPVRLEAIVKECLKLLRASLPATIELRSRAAAGLGQVLTDPTQIHQVIMNLCTNAADAMRQKGGILEISLTDAELAANDPDGAPHLPAGRYVRLTVSDTGEGIDRKTMARIFDPFFTTKEPGRGTGLGLSVVHGIVRNHGGGITFRSEVGQGTVFHVFLPRLEPTEETPDAQEPGGIPGGRERLLLLDDEEDLVHSWERMLGDLGYEVVAGTDSLEALEVFRAQPDRFDLLITDQTMPHLTGIRLAREILRLRPDLPIILCTGFGHAAGGEMNDQGDPVKGIRAVVRKPVERGELARVIRRVLDER